MYTRVILGGYQPIIGGFPAGCTLTHHSAGHTMIYAYLIKTKYIRDVRASLRKKSEIIWNANKDVIINGFKMNWKFEKGVLWRAIESEIRFKSELLHPWYMYMTVQKHTMLYYIIGELSQVDITGIVMHEHVFLSYSMCGSGNMYGHSLTLNRLGSGIKTIKYIRIKMDFAICYDLLFLNTLNKYTHLKLSLKYLSLL